MGTSSYHVCYHCKDRTIGCHAHCEPYQKEVEEHKRLKEIEKQSKRYAGASREVVQWNHRALSGKSHKK